MEKKILNEIRRMQELAGIISESIVTLNEEMASSNDLAFKIDDVMKKVKKMSLTNDGGNSFYKNEAMTSEVQKDIQALMEEFIKSEKTSAWPVFQQQASDPKALEDAKRQMVHNEVDNRISNFFFNSGSGSFVRAFGNPYKIQVVQEMKKVADALKLARLSKGLQGAIDAYKRDYKPEESAIDKIRAQAGIQPKNVTSEGRKK